MNYSSISVTGRVYNVAEGRIGTLGQRGSETINNRTVPWIYAVIAFDSTGNFTIQHSTFPTFSVYVNGVLRVDLISAQSAVHDFIYSYDASNELDWYPVP